MSKSAKITLGVVIVIVLAVYGFFQTTLTDWSGLMRVSRHLGRRWKTSSNGATT